jgi:rieske iron-sulfur protein
VHAPANFGLALRLCCGLRKQTAPSAFFSAKSSIQLCAMSDSDRITAGSAECSCAEPECAAHASSTPTRRTVILSALAASASMATLSSAAAADESQPGKDERPQKADLLVVSEGEHAGEVIKPEHLKLGGPPMRAWPKDPKTSVVRDGSRLNELLVVRLEPAELDDATRARAADGIVAYSAICTHAGCPVTGWLKASSGEKDAFKCFCHNSEFDPREGAQVVFGPAPRRLAALPLAISDGSLTVAAGFAGKVGAQQGG